MTPTLEPFQLTVRVQDSGRNGLLEVSWQAGTGWQAYSIDAGLLGRCADEVRRRLSELTKQAYNEGKDVVAPCGRQLKGLAEAGHKLYQALFTEKRSLTGIPERVQRYLKQRQQAKAPCQIQFSVQDRIFIPWGLIYGDDPAALTGKDEDVGVESYEAFWCLRYFLATTYDQIAPSWGRDRIDPGAFRVLSACCKAVVSQVCKKMSRSERREMAEFVRTCRPAFKKRDLLSRWKAVGERWGLLYFLCHATPTRVALGPEEGEEINIDDFDLTLKDGRPAADGEEMEFLVFLNGCLTAVGANEGGFLEATGGKGFVGFIGTEVEVPDVFAARFGQAFLRCLLHSDWPVYRVMHCLRRQYWPLSLLYGTYCDPSIRVRLREGGEPCVCRNRGS